MNGRRSDSAATYGMPETFLSLLTSNDWPPPAKAKIKFAYDLADDESGQMTLFRNKHVIVVNGNHREERQRFTVLHEIAHIVLALPSQHHGTTLKTGVLLRYGRRAEEEVLCDVFAAECLLPYDLFASQVADTDISLDAVKSLAKEYKASLTATGSRFALNANEPCAFVLSEDELHVQNWL